MRYAKLIQTRYKFETRKEMNNDEFFAALTKFYDGFQFSPDSRFKVFSPYSLLSYLKKAATTWDIEVSDKDQNLKLVEYWYSTGTNSPFLYATEKYPLSLFSALQIPGIHAIEQELVEKSIMPEQYHEHPYLQMFHSGYLTIDKYDKNTVQYFLRFPNEEVKNAFEKNVKGYRDATFKSTIADLVNQKKWNEAFDEIQDWFAKHSKQINDNKLFYHSMLFTIMRQNMNENDYCEITQRLVGGTPDMMYGHHTNVNECMMMPIGVKYRKKDSENIKGTAVKRNYVLKAKMDEKVKKWIGNKNTEFYIMDLVFGNGSLFGMRVHSYSNGEGILVFSRTNSDAKGNLKQVKPISTEELVERLKPRKDSRK